MTHDPLAVSGFVAATGAAPSQRPVPRAVAMRAAVELLDELREEHGPLMIHQSGGCCDGSAPMCYPRGEFLVGDREVLLGVLDLRLFAGQRPPDLPGDDDAVPVWISPQQFEAWQHTQLVLDVVPGRGAGFSVESPRGVRFLTRSRVFTPAEAGVLIPVLTGADWEAGERPVLSGAPLVVASVAEACIF